jgi:hypothetical protein
MALSPSKIASLKRMGKVLAATVVSALIGLAASPDAANVVGTDKSWVLAAVLIPVLHEALTYLTGRGASEGK